MAGEERSRENFSARRRATGSSTHAPSPTHPVVVPRGVK